MEYICSICEADNCKLWRPHGKFWNIEIVCELVCVNCLLTKKVLFGYLKAEIQDYLLKLESDGFAIFKKVLTTDKCRYVPAIISESNLRYVPVFDFTFEIYEKWLKLPTFPYFLNLPKILELK